MSDVTALLWTTMWALLFVCVLAVAEAAADPLTMFQGIGGRLNADPVVLSGSAGCLVIITLILNALRPRLWMKLLTLLSFVIMIVSFGKSGILATVIAATVFLLFRKSLASSVGLLGGMGVVAAILMTTIAPLAKYFTGYEGGSTLTGRTEIWQKGLDVIRQHPWLGNGYLATKFMWTMERGPLADVGHLHNGFLEALYNNGIVGLVFLIGIHVSILTNLFYAKRTVRTYQKAGGSDQANTLIVGCFALYLDLFIYGLVTPAFGGRPTVHFMVFLSILGASVALRKFAQQVEEQPAKPVRPVALWQERFPAPSPSST
jgi:O-antigen ligase